MDNLEEHNIDELITRAKANDRAAFVNKYTGVVQAGTVKRC